MHYGQVVLGSLGTPRFHRVTIVGDAVNFASRIESANKDAGTHLLISEATYHYIKDQVQEGRAIRVPRQRQNGRTHPL